MNIDNNNYMYNIIFCTYTLSIYGKEKKMFDTLDWYLNFSFKELNHSSIIQNLIILFLILDFLIQQLQSTNKTIVVYP